MDYNQTFPRTMHLCYIISYINAKIYQISSYVKGVLKLFTCGVLVRQEWMVFISTINCHFTLSGADAVSKIYLSKKSKLTALLNQWWQHFPEPN